MLKIGVTGSIGMGKSAVSSHFKAVGFPVFDADKCVHKLYSQGGKAVQLVAEQFPEALVNGGICRKVLSTVVIGNDHLLIKLEGIIHPLVQRERLAFHNIALEQKQLCAVFDIPLLIENKVKGKQSDVEIDYVAVVTANREVQEERVMRRPNMSKDKLELILAKQIPDAEKRKMADYLVHTDIGDDYTAAKAQVANLIEDIVDKNGPYWQEWLSHKHFSISEANPSAVVDTIVFDLDDTLVDFTPIISNAMDELIQYAAVEMPLTFAGGSTDCTDQVALKKAFNDRVRLACER